ncbi:hypothetical protein B0H13DRAFT_1892183 [Mycena leptocephala]|nr:hypothetical protein B0H13DRAFT_1892183 [Mycena leptocephala]
MSWGGMVYEHPLLSLSDLLYCGNSLQVRAKLLVLSKIKHFICEWEGDTQLGLTAYECGLKLFSFMFRKTAYEDLLGEPLTYYLIHEWLPGVFGKQPTSAGGSSRETHYLIHGWSSRSRKQPTSAGCSFRETYSLIHGCSRETAYECGLFLSRNLFLDPWVLQGNSPQYLLLRETTLNSLLNSTSSSSFSKELSKHEFLLVEPEKGDHVQKKREELEQKSSWILLSSQVAPRDEQSRHYNWNIQEPTGYVRDLVPEPDGRADQSCNRFKGDEME